MSTTCTARETRRFTARVRRVPGAPVFSARLWLRGGLRVEPLPGVSLLTGRSLVEGTADRTWDQIALDAENLGMVLQSFGTGESIGVSIDAMAEDWELALDWLAEVAFTASFPDERVAWLCRQAGAELESLLDQPEARAARAFQNQLYHPHPFARSLHGDLESLTRIRSEHCRVFHRQVLAYGGCVVAAGAIDEEAVHQKLAGLFPSDEPAEPLPSVAAPEGHPERRREVRLASEQAHLYLGQLTVPRNHPQVPALELLGVVLGAGSGLSGRLPERIREAEGLAYSVDARTVGGSGLEPGRFVVYVGTAPETVAQAERSVREELDRLLRDGIEDTEMEDARSYLLGRDPFRRETARQWADLLAETELYGIPVDQPDWVRTTLEALKKEDIESAARQWIRPDELRVTLGLPA